MQAGEPGEKVSSVKARGREKKEHITSRVEKGSGEHQEAEQKKKCETECVQES